jgi:hypothetical protein
MRRVIVYLFYLVIFLLLLALPSIVRRLRFQGLDAAERREVPTYEPADLPARVPTPAASAFEDEPEPGEGQILLDVAHENFFDLSEIGFLDSRLAARGYELVPFENGDLVSALRPVNALVVVAPMADYTAVEVQAVSDFVARGGRLLLIGDPTRFSFDFGDEGDALNVRLDTDQIPLNSLANEFDLVFNGDYLYNTVENEGNFRNIVLEQDGMSESHLTEDVERLAFYGSHSIQLGRDSQPLLTGDDNTWSSATDRPGGLALAALGDSERVLAVGDIDFLSEPYYTVFDNSRFIAHLADFLTEAGRDFVLADFPYFYDEAVKLVFVGDPQLGPGAFGNIISLQEAFRLTGRRLELADEASSDSDTFYLGLYNQAAEVEELLEEAGISLVIDPPIESDEAADAAGDEGASAAASEDAAAEEEGAPVDGDTAEEEKATRLVKSGIGEVQMSGTALVVLNREDDMRRVIVLASSGEGLANVTDRLINLIPVDAEEALSDCLLQEGIALCPTNVVDEPVEADLETSEVPAPEEMPQDEPDVDAESGGEGIDLAGLGAELQGAIGMDESVDGTLEADQAHAWTFGEGPALVNIVLQPGEELDGVLELYDPNGDFVLSADSAFTGEEERLELIDISDDGDYTIIVRDFFEDGGDYTLIVEGVTPDDLGVAEQGELTPGEAAEDVLEEDQLHAWTFQVDEPVSVNITLSGGPEMDGFVILFDPENAPVAFADDSLSGGEEFIEEVSLEALGTYTIVVGDFLGFGGEYSLLLEIAG